MTQIALGIPDKELLSSIYRQITDAHFVAFDDKIRTLAGKIVDGTVQIFNTLALQAQFMPTALKFHYQFNMRDVAKIIQGVMLAQPSIYKGNTLGLARMWAHELNRVVHDRLLFDEDRSAFLNYVKLELRKMGDIKEDAVYEEPLIFTNFISIAKGHEAAYKPVIDIEELREVLEDKLAEYNENIAQMDLVLFNQAMEHICRISRIIYNPAGNALLVGVGGSGKQSLTKLTSFIHSYEIFRIVVATNYSVADLKTDIQTLFMKAGV